jgi:GMP synthase (glutamine-hydrolysing)
MFQIVRNDTILHVKVSDYIADQVEQIRQKVGNERVLLALSGGVDSSVCASLLSKAIPGQLVCVFVDHGCMRLNEGDEIEKVFSEWSLQFIRVNAQDRFLARLKGVSDPETKRKRIGEEFIRVFEEEAKKLGKISFLAQGTIYPDIVKSGAEYDVILKSHHSAGGLPKNFPFTGLIEPLSELFKNDVYQMGKELELPSFLMDRQPFPVHGLAIRVIGEVTKEKLDILRKADAIFTNVLFRAVMDGIEIEDYPSQYFAILTDSLSVGMKDDKRTYSPVIALRAVNTHDFMQCEYAPLPHGVLTRVAERITQEIPSVSRVVYDITSKPPATIEWV